MTTRVLERISSKLIFGKIILPLAETGFQQMFNNYNHENRIGIIRIKRAKN